MWIQPQFSDPECAKATFQDPQENPKHTYPIFFPLHLPWGAPLKWTGLEILDEMTATPHNYLPVRANDWDIYLSGVGALVSHHSKDGVTLWARRWVRCLTFFRACTLNEFYHRWVGSKGSTSLVQSYLNVAKWICTNRFSKYHNCILDRDYHKAFGGGG